MVVLGYLKMLDFCFVFDESVLYRIKNGKFIIKK